MQIIRINDMVYGGEVKPSTPLEAHLKRDGIIKALDAPIEHTQCDKISHDTKTDRYVATFRTSNMTATLKVTNGVAQFLAVHQGDDGYWRLRMDEQTGAVVDAYLVVE